MFLRGIYQPRRVLCVWYNKALEGRNMTYEESQF